MLSVPPGTASVPLEPPVLLSLPDEPHAAAARASTEVPATAASRVLVRDMRSSFVRESCLGTAEEARQRTSRLRHRSVIGRGRADDDRVTVVTLARSNTGDVSRSVLLVEDDARVRRVLRLALEDEGYRVAEADSGDAGLHELARSEPDVVLLDLMLPDLDGFSVCRRIRRDSDVPVIMVTARTDSHDVVAGLEAGADDYATKPLIAKELSARIRALLRRSEVAGRHPVKIVVGDLEIGLEEGGVTRAGRAGPLTPTG